MLPLADLQRAVHGAILGGEPRGFGVTGALALAEAISVHRNTAIGGLINALRLAYPSVDALVGESYFDQVAREYVLTHPSRQACLDEYGATFARYLETVETAQSLPYLGDVARLDKAVAQALRYPNSSKTFTIDAQVSIRIPVSLVLLNITFPAHIIRASLNDDAALAAIAMDANSYCLAVWRHHDQAAVRVLREPAGRFLETILSGATPAVALAQAANDSVDALPIIQADIFAAPFCAVIPLAEDLT